MRRSALGLAALLLAAALLGARPASAAPPGSPWGEEFFTNTVFTTHEGKRVRLYDDLIRDKHVVLAFVYTRCTRVCGLMTAKLVQTQRELGERVGKDIFFYAITLDPEHDTPEQLKQYAGAFKAGPGFTFLTGRPEDIQRLRRKLGDKYDVADHTTMVNVGHDATGQWWTTSSLDNPRYLATIIGKWMDPANRRALQMTEYAKAQRLEVKDRGHKLFRERCVLCHLASGEGVGPDLQGVVARRGRAWVGRWLKEPDRMIAEKDPVAIALLEQAGGIPMPNVGLTNEEVYQLLDYLERMEQAALVPGTGEPPVSAVAGSSAATGQQ